MLKKNIFMAGVAVLAMTSCDDLLDIQPRQSITPELALSNVAGYEGVMASAYNSNMRFTYYGQTMNIAPDVLADNLVIANNTGRYIGESVNSPGSHIELWGLYSNINLCNVIINGIDAVAIKNATEEASKIRLKGEAYFLRALNYHNLHKVYGYEPGKEVNGFNKGVILRTTPTAQLSDANFRERSTVAEGYALMEADLLQAIELLPAEASAGSVYRASKAAAQALLARVYLYGGKFAQAATMADAALAATAKTIVPAADYAASWGRTPHPESIFEVEIRSGDWGSVDGVNNSMASLTNTINTAGQFVVAASADLISSHEAGDIRRDLWSNRDGSGRLQSSKWRGEKGDFMENLPIIRVSEVVLIAAEAKARSGNDAGARTNLNALRAQRGLAATTASGAALTDLILNERRVELVLEGHRFFDLKRLGKDITKPAVNAESLIPYSNFRILGRLPIDQVILSDLLEQNPGY